LAYALASEQKCWVWSAAGTPVVDLSMGEVFGWMAFYWLRKEREKSADGSR
jgi:hypothetical protein